MEIQTGRNYTNLDQSIDVYFKEILDILSKNEKENMNLPLEMESIAFEKYVKKEENKSEGKLFSKGNEDIELLHIISKAP